MGFISKNPRVSSLIETDIAAGTPSNPAVGSFKIVNRNGFLYSRSSAGAETAVTPEVSQAASGVVLSAGQLKGTNTNDNASTGYVGEYLETSGNSTIANGQSNMFFDLDTLTLTAGDWDVTVVLQLGLVNASPPVCATSSNLELSLITAAGNVNTGVTYGINSVSWEEGAYGTFPAISTHQVTTRVKSDGTNLTVAGVTTAGQIIRAKFYFFNVISGAFSDFWRLSARRVR